jgi:hypothetical protein
VFSSVDFLLDVRLRGKAAVVGFVFLGVLVLSLVIFFLAGNGRVERILYFPSEHGKGLIAEPRFLTRHASLEGNITELVDGVLLGPARHDASRLFPRGASVRAAMVRGHTLYLDLSARVLGEDPDVPLRGRDALDLLSRSITFNFPRVHEIVLYLDGQLPGFAPKKNI